MCEERGGLSSLPLPSGTRKLQGMVDSNDAGVLSAKAHVLLAKLQQLSSCAMGCTSMLLQNDLGNLPRSCPRGSNTSPILPQSTTDNQVDPVSCFLPPRF